MRNLCQKHFYESKLFSTNLTHMLRAYSPHFLPSALKVNQPTTYQASIDTYMQVT